MNTRTRPERNLEKLEHEPEKCDWKTTDTQKMRSRKCRTGPSDCGKRPPSSSIYVSTSEVQTTTERITTLSPASLVAWGSAGCQPHNNNDPDWVSNGKQAARKVFPRRSKDQKNTQVNVSTYSTQRRDKEKMIRTRRAGKLYKARSRLYRSQHLQVTSKYSLESSRQDIHNALICTVL